MCYSVTGLHLVKWEWAWAQSKSKPFLTPLKRRTIDLCLYFQNFRKNNLQNVSISLSEWLLYPNQSGFKSVFFTKWRDCLWQLQKKPERLSQYSCLTDLQRLTRYSPYPETNIQTWASKTKHTSGLNPHWMIIRCVLAGTNICTTLPRQRGAPGLSAGALSICHVHHLAGYHLLIWLLIGRSCHLFFSIKKDRAVPNPTPVTNHDCLSPWECYRLSRMQYSVWLSISGFKNRIV